MKKLLLLAVLAVSAACGSDNAPLAPNYDEELDTSNPPPAVLDEVVPACTPVACTPKTVTVFVPVERVVYVYVPADGGEPTECPPVLECPPLECPAPPTCPGNSGGDHGPVTDGGSPGNSGDHSNSGGTSSDPGNPPAKGGCDHGKGGKSKNCN